MALYSKALDDFRKSNATFIILAMTIVGAILFVGGKFIESYLSFPGHVFIGSSMTGLGTLVCASGIASAVMKIIATEGYFLDAVARVIHGREGFQRLSRDQLVDNWVQMTRMLYLENMNAKNVNLGAKHEIESMRDQVEHGIREIFPSESKHFVLSSERHMEFHWEDTEKTTVRVHDVILSKLVPFDATVPLTWQTSIRTESGYSLDDYSFVNVSTTLVDVSGSPLATNTVVSPDNKTSVTTYTSIVKDLHEIRLERICKYPIYKDPNLHSITPFVVKETNVHIRNETDDLVVVFNSLGNDNAFKVISGDDFIKPGARAHVRATRILLPNQGYGLTMVRQKVGT